MMRTLARVLLIAAASARLIAERPAAARDRRLVPARRLGFVESQAPSQTGVMQQCATCAVAVREQACDRVRHALRSDAVRHLLAGAAAGVVSNTITAPLDIMRLNIMVSTDRLGVVQTAQKIWASGGIAEFWRGNTADVVRTIPASAVRFYTFALYKAQLPLALPALAGAAALTSLLAGGFAGMTAMATLFPLETVRTRMATGGALGGVSIIGFGRSIVAEEGLRGLFRGLPPSLVSVMPYFAVRFGVYDILKAWHLRLADADGERLDGGASATYGFMSGLAASGLTFPMEVVRRRVMVGVVSSNPLLAVRSIVAAEGVAGLYKGYGLNIVKVAPSSAITFLVYETVRQWLDAAAAPRPRRAKVAAPKRGAERDEKLGLSGVATNEALTVPVARKPAKPVAVTAMVR